MVQKGEAGEVNKITVEKPTKTYSAPYMKKIGGVWTEFQTNLETGKEEKTASGKEDTGDGSEKKEEKEKNKVIAQLRAWESKNYPTNGKIGGVALTEEQIALNDQEREKIETTIANINAGTQDWRTAFVPMKFVPDSKGGSYGRIVRKQGSDFPADKKDVHIAQHRLWAKEAIAAGKKKADVAKQFKSETGQEL
jgi:hypothetical protein